MTDLGRIIAVTGHYGSGKTNLAVNLAVDLSRAGERVTIVDLDIVNPYFRTADFSEYSAPLRASETACRPANLNPRTSPATRAITTISNIHGDSTWLALPE